MKELIESYRNLGRKESKGALEALAKERFGIELNKQRSFDNMLVDLESELMVRGIDMELSDEDAPEDGDEIEVTEAAPVEPEPEPEIVDIAVPVVSDEKVISVDMPRAPELVGPGSGYLALPFWIYDWVLATVDWKDRIDECPYSGSARYLKPMKYEVERVGSVTVRESRNSRFELIV